MRVSDDVFDNSIASSRVAVCDTIEESALFRVFRFVFEIPPFLVKESFAVGNQELQIACIGTIDVRIIDFVDDAMAEGEPDTATGMIGRADSFLGAARPARFDPRGAEG